MSLRWLEAFLDLPQERYEAGATFWSSVTGFARGAQRGPDGQFMTLVPEQGLDYLRVQRLVDGPRLHLDLHVDDPAAAALDAVRLGATTAPSPFDGVETMRSPGGLVFCFVPEGGGERPPPRTWPDGHLSEVDQVCLDIPPGRYDEEVAFWEALTGWERRDLVEHREFERLTPPDSFALKILVQRLDDQQDAVAAHLDVATTDREAEIAAHVAAGATEGASYDWWTVMTDPAGLDYCITRRPPSPRGDPST